MNTWQILFTQIARYMQTSTVYWPASKEESMQFGSIEISLDDENTEHEGLTKRKFIIQNHKVCTQRAWDELLKIPGRFIVLFICYFLVGMFGKNTCSVFTILNIHIEYGVQK